MTIDDCKRCVVVIGPTEGSIFIRDSEDCKCVFMCRQYRSRDCVNVDTHLHVTTRPIIETSANMRFACFDFHYDKLEAQMATAGISRFQNFWSHVFNFNPETHATWSLMDPKITAFSQLIGGADGTGAELPDFPALEGVSEALKDGAAPPSCCRTWGEREPPAAATGGETASRALPFASRSSFLDKAHFPFLSFPFARYVMNLTFVLTRVSYIHQSCYPRVTDIPARLSSTYYSKTDGDLGTSTGGGARDGCLILIPAADAKMAGELLQMADAAKVLLMRTNDCQLSEPWLRTFLTEGGVAANEVAKLAKQLSTGRAIGLEFGGDGCADAMRGVASSGGFAMLEDPDQYAEWRYMGVEG